MTLNLCNTDRAVQSKGEKHGEKENCPERSSWQCCYSFGIHLEHQSVALRGDFGDGQAFLVGHVAQVGKDHEPAVEAGETVDGDGEQTIPTRKQYLRKRKCKYR